MLYMIVGVMTIQLHLTGIDSLKAKRSIVKSVVNRLANRFNVSAAEVAHHQSKQSALVGVAVVAVDTDFANQQLDAVLNFMSRDHRFYMGPVERETFS